MHGAIAVVQLVQTDIMKLHNRSRKPTRLKVKVTHYTVRLLKTEREISLPAVSRWWRVSTILRLLASYLSIEVVKLLNFYNFLLPTFLPFRLTLSFFFSFLFYSFFVLRFTQLKSFMVVAHLWGASSVKFFHSSGSHCTCKHKGPPQFYQPLPLMFDLVTHKDYLQLSTN